MVKRIDRMTRVELGLETPKTEPWSFDGLDVPFDIAMECWQMWRDHGTLPHAGGWLEQPQWVRRTFMTLNAIYNTRYVMNKPKRDD